MTVGIWTGASPPTAVPELPSRLGKRVRDSAALHHQPLRGCDGSCAAWAAGEEGPPASSQRDADAAGQGTARDSSGSERKACRAALRSEVPGPGGPHLTSSSILRLSETALMEPVDHGLIDRNESSVPVVSHQHYDETKLNTRMLLFEDRLYRPGREGQRGRGRVAPGVWAAGAHGRVSHTPPIRSPGLRGGFCQWAS